MKSSLTLFQVLGIFLAAISVLYAILHGDFRRLEALSFKIGDIYAMCSVFCLSVYTFLQGRKPSNISDTTFLTFVAVGVALLNFPVFIYHELQTKNILTFTEKEIAVLLYLGIGISFISYLCWKIATRKIGPLKTGFIHYFSVPFTALLNFILMGSPISRFQIISCCGLIFSSFLINKKRVKNPVNC